MAMWRLAIGLATVAHARFVQVGDGQCNGGVGGYGEHYCLVGGHCNEGGEPTKPATEPGTGCPGAQEYLLCTEDVSVTVDSCREACTANTNCVGFLVSRHEAKNKGRCELHTKVIEYAAAALDCYTYDDGSFTSIGKGACRTKVPTVGGPANGTHYGYMKVYWVENFNACKSACQDSTQKCVGVEYHSTAASNKQFKCEVHFEELSAAEMSVFQCHAEPNCMNSYKCGGGMVHKDNAKTTKCTPQNELMTFPSCSESMCCRSTSTNLSAAGPGASWRPAVLIGLLLALLAH